MNKGICGGCYKEDVEVFPATCAEHPEDLINQPIGSITVPIAAQCYWLD